MIAAAGQRGMTKSRRGRCLLAHVAGTVFVCLHGGAHSMDVRSGKKGCKHTSRYRVESLEKVQQDGRKTGLGRSTVRSGATTSAQRRAAAPLRGGGRERFSRWNYKFQNTKTALPSAHYGARGGQRGSCGSALPRAAVRLPVRVLSAARTLVLISNTAE